MELCPPSFEQLPSDVWGLIWDCLPLKQYPQMRLVCARWYNIHKNRNHYKFWNSIRLIQTVHEKGIATVPALPNRKWHGRLYSYLGAQRIPYYYCDYVMGQKHGEERYFFTKTAQTKIECSYYLGQHHGDWKEYSILGTLLTWKCFLNGKLHGHERNYDPVTEKLRTDTQWFNGKKHGVAKTWRWDNGAQRTTKYFVLGVEMVDLETYLRMMNSVTRPID